MRRKKSLSAQRSEKETNTFQFQQPQPQLQPQPQPQPSNVFHFPNVTFSIGTKENKPKAEFKAKLEVNTHRPSNESTSPVFMDISPQPQNSKNKSSNNIEQDQNDSKDNLNPNSNIPTFNIGSYDASSVPTFSIGGNASVGPQSPSGRKILRSTRRTKLANKVASPTVKKSATSDDNNRNGTVDYSGRSARVDALKHEGGDHYAAKRYVESACSYSYAINAHTFGGNINLSGNTNKPDSLLSTLFSNRAAAFLMCGAYSLAAQDGENALKCFSQTLNNQDLIQIQNISKIQCRLARAYLKAGELDKARAQFNASIAKVNYAMEKYSQLCQSDDSVICTLNQTKTSAEISINTISRMEKLYASYDTDTSWSFDKRLSIVNELLSTSPGSLSLFETKVELLKNLSRWDEIAEEAEQFACKVSEIEQVYILDISSFNPYPNAPVANHLKRDSFENGDKSVNLTPQASSEAVLRMPEKVRPIYLRALRLEERYDHADAAICLLEKSRTYYARYVTQERDFLRRTQKSKSDGDDLFRKREYELAASRYNVCLKIDSNTNRVSSSGGKLHAILHCNRAACFMAVDKYRDAAKECTAALRIHVSFNVTICYS